MVKLIGKIAAAFRVHRAQAWNGTDPWTKTDARLLREFFNSEVGRKLKRVLRDNCIAQNAAALSLKEGLPWHAGYAIGQSALVELLATLATPEAISEPEESDSPPDPS